MICSKCGIKVEDGAIYCPNCGNLIEKKVEEARNNTNDVKTKRAKVMSRISIIIGIISLSGVMYLYEATLKLSTMIVGVVAMVLAIIGLILAIIAHKQVNSIAGIIINSICIVLVIYAIVLMNLLSIIVHALFG